MILFVLLCCFGFCFLNTYFRQTNKLITPTSCRDASNHIRGAVLPNRCCQDSTESSAALAKACSDARADKESLCPCCCCAAAPAAKPHPPASTGTFGAPQQRPPAEPFLRCEAEALQEQSECAGRLISSARGSCNVDLNAKSGFTYPGLDPACSEDNGSVSVGFAGSWRWHCNGTLQGLVLILSNPAAKASFDFIRNRVGPPHIFVREEASQLGLSADERCAATR